VAVADGCDFLISGDFLRHCVDAGLLIVNSDFGDFELEALEGGDRNGNKPNWEGGGSVRNVDL